MSINEPHADPDVIEFESTLAGLRPQPSRISRDRLLFEAGRAESLRQVRLGRHILGIATGTAVLAAAAFGFLLVDARRQLGELEIALQTRAAAPVAGRERSQVPDPPSTRAVPPELPQVTPPPAAVAGPSAGGPRGESAGVTHSSADWPARYAGLRGWRLRPGSDFLADISRSVAPPPPAGSRDAPRTNGELRQEYLQRATQQPAEFEALLRGLPVPEGERS
jgi:hypothetical protein